MVEAILQLADVLLAVLLHLKSTNHLSVSKLTFVDSVVLQIDLHSKTMLLVVVQFSVVNYPAVIVHHSFVDLVPFDGLSEIHAIFVLFNLRFRNWVIEQFQHPGKKHQNVLKRGRAAYFVDGAVLERDVGIHGCHFPGPLLACDPLLLHQLIKILLFLRLPMPALGHIGRDPWAISLDLLQVLVQILLDLFEAVGGQSKPIDPVPVAHVEPELVADGSIALPAPNRRGAAWNMAQWLL